MGAALICEYQQIHIYNVTNGERFITYALASETPGEICVNGAATHKADVGDILIICTYKQYWDKVTDYPITKVFVDGNNAITRVDKAWSTR
jgi:aspartate 1-decarboxylase